MKFKSLHFLALTALCVMHTVHSKATSELLGLIEEHESSVVEYLRFARYKREQRLATVDGAFEDVRDVT